MPFSSSVEAMTAEQRLSELASLLARGLLRLHQRRGPAAGNDAESAATCLEERLPSSLNGPTGEEGSETGE